MVETWLVAAVAGLFGLVVGSFLNVCALRWPADQSVISPRSRCPACDSLVRWYDNIPALSWLLLRGRCRSCGAAISVQYPMVELATGLVWAGAFTAYGLSGEALRGSVFLTILFGISISDARFYIIPDQFSVGGAAVGFLLSFLPGGPTWVQSLIGGVVGYGVLWLVGVAGTALIKRLSPGRLEEAGVDQAMGGGDVKMMMMIGAFVGIWGVALTVFLGSVLALLVFGPISAISKRLVPLGVFLAAAGAVTYAWGQQMIEWYLTSVVGL
ncbi:MAG TPA: prepilin peptidase [Longimicrobiales bacterium]|nr:prepilin peptidase [Longimicrobiales bacterium]